MLHCRKLRRLQQLLRLTHVKPKLRLLRGDMELQQAVNHTVMLRSLLVHRLQQMQAVYTVNHAHILGDILNFIRLQMANKMPFNILRQHSVLVAHFQCLVLTKQPLPRVIRLLQHLHRLRLRHGHQPHTVGKDRTHLCKIFLYHSI